MDGLIDFRLDAAPLRVGEPGNARPGTTRACDVIHLERRARGAGFTARDRSELERWAVAERRATIWDSDPAPFAMLYDGARPWASWAVSREDGELLAWNCVTFEDIGRFGSMIEALEAISGPCSVEAPSNLIVLSRERLRRGGEAAGGQVGDQWA